MNNQRCLTKPIFGKHRNRLTTVMIALTIIIDLVAIACFFIACRSYIKLKKIAKPKQSKDAMSFAPVDLVFGKVEAETDARPLQRRIVTSFTAAVLLLYASASLIRHING